MIGRAVAQSFAYRRPFPFRDSSDGDGDGGGSVRRIPPPFFFSSFFPLSLIPYPPLFTILIFPRPPISLPSLFHVLSALSHPFPSRPVLSTLSNRIESSSNWQRRDDIWIFVWLSIRRSGIKSRIEKQRDIILLPTPGEVSSSWNKYIMNRTKNKPARNRTGWSKEARRFSFLYIYACVYRVIFTVSHKQAAAEHTQNCLHCHTSTPQTSHAYIAILPATAAAAPQTIKTRHSTSQPPLQNRFSQILSEKGTNIRSRQAQLRRGEARLNSLFPPLHTRCGYRDDREARPRRETATSACKAGCVF